MSNGEIPGGVPGAGPDLIRTLVDDALLLTKMEGAREDTSGGVAPARRLGDFVENGLHTLYGATAGKLSIEGWLVAALGIPDVSQITARGPQALARQFDAVAKVPPPEFELIPMTDEEDAQDRLVAKQASDVYAGVPDAT